jgi:hypothetical protein
VTAHKESEPAEHLLLDNLGGKELSEPVCEVLVVCHRSMIETEDLGREAALPATKNGGAEAPPLLFVA